MAMYRRKNKRKQIAQYSSGITNTRKGPAVYKQKASSQVLGYIKKSTDTPRSNQEGNQSADKTCTTDNQKSDADLEIAEDCSERVIATSN